MLPVPGAVQVQTQPGSRRSDDLCVCHRKGTQEDASEWRQSLDGGPATLQQMRARVRPEWHAQARVYVGAVRWVVVVVQEG